jgi:glycosyltransferase involved in cell wall biosynthesis
MTGSLLLSAQRRAAHPFDYLLTFQGEEIASTFAERIGRLDDFLRMLHDVVAASRWPAVAVSADYACRLHQEMGIGRDRLRVIYPAIVDPPPAGTWAGLQAAFPSLVPGLPIVAFVGRQDSEKGIDLLLYAARILRSRGVRFQLAICGASAFGDVYRETIARIAQHLRLEIHHAGLVPDAVRETLYQHARCVVYPSIHREPFGLVAAEAMRRGTPVLVPDRGGIAEVISSQGRVGGLTFRTWDSGDLAVQIERLLTDDRLHGELAANAEQVAQSFNLDRMADAFLELIESA